MSRKAFTLTELSAVVVIIGILARISVPTYRRQVEKAEAVRLCAELRQAVPPLAEYYQIHGHFDGITSEDDQVKDSKGRSLYGFRLPDNYIVTALPVVMPDPDGEDDTPSLAKCLSLCLARNGNEQACLNMCGFGVGPLDIHISGTAADILDLEDEFRRPNP